MQRRAQAFAGHGEEFQLALPAAGSRYLPVFPLM